MEKIKLDFSNLNEVVEKTIEEKKKNKEWFEKYVEHEKYGNNQTK